MALELLVSHFDELIRTPEDVQRLNEAILQLAVQGKLVPQDPNHEPAERMLSRIVEARLTSGSKVLRPIQAIDADIAPYALPTSWVWVRVDDAGVINPRNNVDADTPVLFTGLTQVRSRYGLVG